MKANAEPVPLPPVAIDAELSLSFAVRLRGGLCTRFRPNSLHSVAPAQQSHRGPRRSDSVAPARNSQADGAISVGYARRHTDAFGYVVLANELSLVIAPIAGLLGALIGHGVAPGVAVGCARYRASPRSHFATELS